MPTPEPDFSPNHKLTPQQHQVINILADGGTAAEAAAAAGVHRNTIRNWRRSVPSFARELYLASEEQALFWHEQAVALAPKAIDVLRTILHNENASPSLKLRAATTVLKMAAEPKTPLHKHAQPGQAELDAIDGELLTFQRILAEQAADAAPQTVRKAPEPGRNSSCPCNSGLKYKRCCAGKLETTQAA